MIKNVEWFVAILFGSLGISTVLFPPQSFGDPGSNPVRHLSGTVQAATVGLPDVWLLGLPGSVVSQSDGTFSVQIEADWTGHVTPRLPGYRFEPESRLVEAGTEPLELDFAAFERSTGFSRLWMVQDDAELRFALLHSRDADRVLVSPGTYSTGGDLDVLDDAVTVQAIGEPGGVLFLDDRPRLRGELQLIEGVVFESTDSNHAALDLSSVRDVRIRNCSLRSAPQGIGLRLRNISNLLMEGGQLTDSNHPLYLDEGTSSGELAIRGVRVMDNVNGLRFLASTDLTLRIENSIFSEHQYNSLQVSGAFRDVQLSNLLFYGNGTGIDLDDLDCPIEVAQVTMVDHSNDAISLDSAIQLEIHDSIFVDNTCSIDGNSAEVAIDHVMYEGELGCAGSSYSIDEATVLEEDPIFFDPGTADYRLAPGSPAMDFGRDGQEVGAYGGDLGASWNEPTALAVPQLRKLVMLDAPRHLSASALHTFRVEGHFSHGYTGTVHHQVEWTSSAPDVLVSLGNGDFEALQEGSATISAELEGIRADLEVQVVDSGGAVSNVSQHSTREEPTTLPRVQQRNSEKALPEEAGWALMESLEAGRAEHSVTLLADGRVLVAGGRRAFETLADVEIYDPSTRNWAFAAPMTVPRSNHSATLLGDGRVLVVGGTVGETTTAEMYDPRLDFWSPAASLQVTRARHTATLLKNGHVLIAGGDSSGPGEGSTAETYSPRLDDWSLTGPMPGKRDSHTATMLDDGRVLSIHVGGAEIYNPDDFSWVPVTPPPLELAVQHTATRLVNGQILVVGLTSSSSGSPFLYDAEEDRWTLTGTMVSPRQGHRAVLLADGRLLVAGGETGSGFPTLTETFDPATSTWQSAGELTSPRVDHGLMMLATGHPLLVAGQSPNGETARCELYTPGVGRLSESSELEEPRMDAASALLADGRLMVTGGRHSGGVASTEIYDPTQDAWSPAAPLGTAGGGRTAISLVDGDVLVVGRLNSERWTEETDSWELQGPRVYPGNVTKAIRLINGHVLAISIDGAEVYDPETRTWSATGNMLVPRSEPVLVTLASGQVLAIGGYLGRHPSGAGSVRPDVEIYDPLSGTWRSAARMQWPRRHHVAAVLPSGEVLVAGGYDGTVRLIDSEIYSPRTDTWRLAGTTSSAHERGVAVPLANGNVWVIAGSVTAAADASDATDVFDPWTETWRPGPFLGTARYRHSAALLSDGSVLVIGGSDAGGRALGSTERLSMSGAVPRPLVTSVNATLRYGEPLRVEGQHFGGGPEGHGGGVGVSTNHHPVLQLQRADGGRTVYLQPEPRPIVGLTVPSWYDEPQSVTVPRLPPDLEAGLYFLRVWRGGTPSLSKVLPFECSVHVFRQPEDAAVTLGESASFSVDAVGVRRFQWRRNGVPIQGATAAEYVTPPISPNDAGDRYDVLMDAGCSEVVSNSVAVEVIDDEPPWAEVVAPGHGEFLLLPQDGESPRNETIVWNMSDNVRICSVEVALQASPTGDGQWMTVDGWPRSLEETPCLAPGLTTQNLIFELDQMPPAGVDGFTYRVRLRVKDLAGLETEVLGGNFSIVRANPEGIKTLILTHTGRLRHKFETHDASLNPKDEPLAPSIDELMDQIETLRGQTQVSGLLVDMADHGESAQLYDAWDESTTPEEGVRRGNEVLFGRTSTAEGAVAGIHQRILSILRDFPAIEYLVIVGGDDIIPMARIRDGATLWDETNYTHPEYGELSPDDSRVAEALSRGYFLSDDPLALATPVETRDLQNILAIPDLAVGRLVETPSEILASIEAFLNRAGILSLEDIHPEGDHRVMVSGYDFLSDVAGLIDRRWREALGVDVDSSLVDGELIGVDMEGPWGPEDVERKLCGEGLPYGVFSLNGHATHFQEGSPGFDVHTIEGLEAGLISESICEDQGLDLSGRIIYSVGCHGGLPVPGIEEELSPGYLRDLPQTYLGLGVVAYIANSGFGWGLDTGVGYSERLVQVFTNRLTAGGATPVGTAMRSSKLRYFREIRHFDAYHLKTLMQWTLFGLPMYTLDAGILGEPPSDPTLENAGEVRRLGSEEVSMPNSLDLPSELIPIRYRVDLSADGVYEKRDGATGDLLGDDVRCDAELYPRGCYFALNGIAAGGGAGTGDLPIEPYLVYRSQLVGARQHGVLWLGGQYRVEEDWRPVFGNLVSNGGSAEPSPAPQYIVVPPVDPLLPNGEVCRPDDEHISSVVLTTGEVMRDASEEERYQHRRFLGVDIEIFHLGTDANLPCDWNGPDFGDGPFEGSYHRRLGSVLEWEVPVEDETSGVWRVVAVVDTGQLDTATGLGQWVPVELTFDGERWVGQMDMGVSERAIYWLQAVDRQGNVSWVRPRETETSTTGIALQLPDVVQVSLASEPTDLAVDLVSHPETVQTDTSYQYRLGVENHGPVDASAIEVWIDLPAGIRYDGASSLQAWLCAEATGAPQGVFCRLPLLEVGAHSEVQLTVLAPMSEGEFPVTARVASNGDELEPADNMAAVTTHVVAPRIVDLDLQLDNGSDVVEMGSVVTYHLTLVNHGPERIDLVHLDIALNALSDVSILPVDGQLSDSIWFDLDLAPTETSGLTLTGRVPSEGAGETLVIQAAIETPAPFEDPNIQNNMAVDEDVMLDLPPRVVQAQTVAATPQGILEGDAKLRTAVSQLLAQFNEPVLGADDPGVQHLVSAGENGVLETEDCEDVVGDDEMHEVALEWIPSGHMTTLIPTSGVLEGDRYRWLICPGIVDAAGQPMEDTPWHLDFSVEVMHLLDNPNFDQDLVGWELETTASSFIVASNFDAGEQVTSGSSQVAGIAPSEPTALSQCVPVTSGDGLRLGGRARGIMDPGGLAVVTRVSGFETMDCSGHPVFVHQDGSTPTLVGDEWQSLVGLSLDIPEDVLAIRATWEVQADGAGLYEILLDDLSAYVHRYLFGDDFETGDLRNWSAVVP